jgi:hypothetical protein
MTNQGQDPPQALGFTLGKTSCTSTLFIVFGKLDKQMFEAQLGGWADSVIASTPTP